MDNKLVAVWRALASFASMVRRGIIAVCVVTAMMVVYVFGSIATMGMAAVGLTGVAIGAMTSSATAHRRRRRHYHHGRRHSRRHHGHYRGRHRSRPSIDLNLNFGRRRGRRRRGRRRRGRRRRGRRRRGRGRRRR